VRDMLLVTPCAHVGLIPFGLDFNVVRAHGRLFLSKAALSWDRVYFF
jgi:hypothetical protein